MVVSYFLFRNSMIRLNSCGSKAVVLRIDPLANVRDIFLNVEIALAEYGIHQASGKRAM